MPEPTEHHEVGLVEFALEIGPVRIVAQSRRGGAARIRDPVVVGDDSVAMNLVGVQGPSLCGLSRSSFYHEHPAKPARSIVRAVLFRQALPDAGETAMTHGNDRGKNDPMRIATWNVNSIKQRLEHLAEFLKTSEPD